MAIVADFESYPQWNDEVRAVYALARYDGGRPSQRRLDTVIQGMEGAYIQAVYHPSPVQIHTVVQQGDLFRQAGAAVLGRADRSDDVADPRHGRGWGNSFGAGFLDRRGRPRGLCIS